MRLTKKKKAEIEKKEAGVNLPAVAPPSVEDFYKTISRDELVQALEVSDAPEAKQLLEGMLQTKPWSFMTLCKNSGMSFTHLVELFGKYQLHVGTVRLMRHVPKVLEDTAIDAQSRSEACPRCDGEGTLLDSETKVMRQCPLCRGAKEVRVPGDRLARELVFESAGLTGKKGPSVAIQQNFGGDHSIESSVSMTRKLLVP